MKSKVLAVILSYEDVDELINDWFVRNNLDSSHAYRDRCKICGASKLLSFECLSEIERAQTKQVKRIEEICDAAFPY